jgi:hypothetical protein
MKALIRHISEYSGADLLLGVFTTDAGAQEARAEYIARYARCCFRDPWARQPYRRVSLTADVAVDRIRACKSCATGAARAKHVTVVSVYSEGFGQVVREIDSAHVLRTCAKRRAAELSQGADSRSFPKYALLQEVAVDRLASDAPGNQPSIGSGLTSARADGAGSRKKPIKRRGSAQR